MGMGTPAESSPSEAHLNDLAARTIIENSGGFITVKIPDVEMLSESERLTVIKKAQELQKKMPFSAEDLSSRLRDLTPPIDSEEELEEGRVLELQARKELEDDGCPPCYPPDLDLPLDDPPEEYQAIIKYWRSVDDVVLCYQNIEWKKFRNIQAIVRCRPRTFNKFVEEVRERRQRYGLGGDVRLLLDREQQSRLDDWIEFQNRHLKRLEQLEKERITFKQELDDDLQLAGDRNTTRPKFGPTYAEALEQRLDATDRDLKAHHVLLHWIEQQRLTMDPGNLTSVKEGYENQDATPKAVRMTSTHRSRTKQAAGPLVLGKVRVKKAKSKKQNTRSMRIQKLKAPEPDPPIQKLDVILQSSTSQAPIHPETKPRGTKIDRSLRQIQPQSLFKASPFAGIRVKSPSGPLGRGAEQTQSLDRERRTKPQRAQTAPTFTTRSGRKSRPPKRWAPGSGAFATTPPMLP